MLCAVFSPIFIAILVVPVLVGGDESDKFKNLDSMCAFMEKHIARRRHTENIADVTVGDMVKLALATLDEQERVPGPGAPKASTFKGFVQGIVNPEKYDDLVLEDVKGNLRRCVKKLARRTDADGKMRLKLDEPSSDLQNLILNGRELIEKLTFDSQFEFKDPFFINLIRGVLNPFTTKDTMVMDVGIGTGNTGFWSRKVLVELFVEDYFFRTDYKNGAIPYWNAQYNLAEKLNARIHLCAWPKEAGTGQKFRMWLIKVKDESFLQKLDSLFHPQEDDICF